MSNVLGLTRRLGFGRVCVSSSSVLLLNNAPLYEYAALYLPVHLLTGFWFLTLESNQGFFGLATLVA